MSILQYLPFIFALYGQIVNIYYIMSKEVNRQMWVSCPDLCRKLNSLVTVISGQIKGHTEKGVI